MSYPRNVGIKALEIYFPSLSIEQSELEIHDGVSIGKYTIGLGQTRMRFCDDREDIYSFALTAVSSLLKKYDIPTGSIGRLEVGTETLLDKSKSVKSVLMQLFSASGNTNIEGVDTINACYGGTNALLNAINWIESRSWDGRDAIVVAGDIAVYNKGPARPTGGAGIVAILVGPDAPIVLEPGRRGTYMQHAYDFYKPDPTSEYPVVDGKFSNACYIRAIDACYAAYSKCQTIKQSNWNSDGHTNGHTNGATNGATNRATNGYTNGYSNGVVNGAVDDHTNGEYVELSRAAADNQASSELDDFDFMCFHTPNCKLVTKSYARLLYNDYRANPHKDIFQDVPAEIKRIDYEDSLANGMIEKTFMKLSEAAFKKRVLPSIQVPKLCGNMYTASLYSSLASLLSNVPSAELQGKRLGLFSYGSGLASSMFSLRVVGDVAKIADAMDLDRRLKAGKIVTPMVYEELMELREKAFLRKDYTPHGDVENIQKGAYYLAYVDDRWRRFYNICQ